MPINRSPPRTLFTVSQSLQHCSSEPNISEKQTITMDETAQNTQRSKRKRTDSSNDQLANFMFEIKAMFMDFKDEQDKKIEKIYTAIEEIKNQNYDIRTSVDFLSQTYETLKNQINELEVHRCENIKYLKTIEEKLEKLERSSRATCLEIRNIPSIKMENKDSLLNTVVNTMKILGVTLQPYDVKDIFRINSKDPSTKPIIVDLSSVLMKEKVIRLYKQYTKGTIKLTTDSLKVGGPLKQIFITENLTPKMKRLFYLSRDFAKVNDYKFCWVSKGKIFLRKREGALLNLIKDESDLLKLQQVM